MRKLTYIQYTNPGAYPPLEHSSRILADGGWQVLFLGIGGPEGYALCFPPHPNIAVRHMSFCPPGWRQKLHYLWFCLWVLVWVLRWRPAFVYASDCLSCPVAVVLSYLPGLHVIYHEHDSPNIGQSPVLGRQSLFMRLALWARRRVSQRAELCVLPNEQRAQRFALQEGNGTNVLCVWNCPRLEEVRPQRPQWNKQKFIVYYHGTIGLSYLPLTVLKAIAMLPSKVHLRVVGYETIRPQGYVSYLKEKMQQLGLANRVEILGPMPRHQLLEQCSACDVGLAFVPMMNHNINNLHKVGASNRPFDYLACGLVILVSDLPDWRAMYVEPGYGLACDPGDPGSIATALRWFLEHPLKMRAMGERGRQRILEEWNYEKQFQPVLERLNGKIQ